MTEDRGGQTEELARCGHQSSRKRQNGRGLKWRRSRANENRHDPELEWTIARATGDRSHLKGNTQESIQTAEDQSDRGPKRQRAEAIEDRSGR